MLAEVLLLIVSCHVSSGNLCRWNSISSQYECQPTPHNITTLVELPPNTCGITNCHNCIKSTQTFIISDDGNLIIPSTFFERPTTLSGNISAFRCLELTNPRGDETSIPCDCAQNCTGSEEFCSILQCDPRATCHCKVERVQYELLHISEANDILNPTLLSVEVCLYKIPSHAVKPRRTLLEYESATFSQHNLTLIFNDPVVSVPEPGKLIARVSGNEIILDVKDDLNVILPFEFVAYKSQLTLIFISSNGKAIHGEISLDGKQLCRATECFFCREFIFQIKCWPDYIAYFLYFVLVLLTLVMLCFLKYVFRGLVQILQVFYFIFYIQYQFVKFILRLFMLGGAVFGSGFRKRFDDFHAYLENHNPQPRVGRAALALVLLCLITTVSADCTSHSILSSNIQNCRIHDGQRTCELFTTAEITLKGLGYEACIWFQDSNLKNVLHLKLRLVSAQCTFSSKRDYFTFPVQEHTISQLACPQNYYCAWGEHCIPNKKFEALTEESLNYPGITNCHPSSVGSGCTIISRMGCLFYRVYLVPDLLRSYEVRSILGHQCTYTIAVERVLNGTQELLTLQSTAKTTDGIFLEILGSYNQAPLHLSDSLVIRVGDPAEAYLIKTSPANRPIAGLVGQVQANQSFTKHFIFDSDLTHCDFFETTLRCVTKPDGLKAMYTNKDSALPLTRDLHLLSIDKGLLRSTLLSTAPVRVQMHFKNFKIHLQHDDVCPKISDYEIKAKGCYACQILSELEFTAVSSCQPGTVSIEFQLIKLFTQSVFIETEPKVFKIQFMA